MIALRSINQFRATEDRLLSSRTPTITELLQPGARVGLFFGLTLWWGKSGSAGQQKKLRVVYIVKISAKKELIGGNRREQ